MSSVRLLAIILLAPAFAACASHAGAPFVPAGPPSAARHAAHSLPVPVDLGRRASTRPVKVTLLLRYNNEEQLERLLDGLARGERGYLTTAQFVARYAPTERQQARVLQTLRAAGFTIARTYPNRTLVDASAPSGVVERFFSTEIHDFRQGRYGIRSANVSPLRIPLALAPLVAAADAKDIVLMHPDIDVELQAPGRNVIRNTGFETGKLSPWKTCRSGSQSPPVIATVHPHGGKYDAYAGTFKGSNEPAGTVAVCQLVKIPKNGVLSAWTFGVSNDHSKRVEEFAVLFDPNTGKAVKTFYKSTENDHKWIARGPYDVSSFAGLREYVAFGVVGSGSSADKHKSIGQYVDDVTLAAVPTPTPAPSSVPCPAAHTGPTPAPTLGPDEGWGPAAVNAGLCMPFNYGYTGAGQTAAIVIDAEVNPTDLADYLQYYGITQTGTITNTLVDGASAAYDTEGEATLDQQTIVGLAPAANVIMYVVPDLGDQHIEDAYNLALTDAAKPGVINSSFGGCEVYRGDHSFGTMTDAIAAQGAAIGVTFSASSGDQGADCYAGSSSDFPFGVQSPASDPHFVGVGGTQSTTAAGFDQCLISATPITNPAVWNDCVGSGGGGISTVWPTPSYQNGINGASATGRNVPDIALPAAFDDICLGCADYGGVWINWSLIWGTSWSSPTYVAMQTEINQACNAKQWGIGTIYGAFAKSGYSDFVDVTKGNNLWQSPYAGSGSYYNATNAFDNVSGIGIPLGMQIAQTNCSAPAIRATR